MSITLTVGNTYPVLSGALTYVDTQGVTQPLNLANSTVKFQLREANDYDFTVDSACSVTDAAKGKVAYTFAPNDLNRDGTFLARFNVRYVSGAELTTDPPVTIIVRAR